MPRGFLKPTSFFVRALTLVLIFQLVMPPAFAFAQVAPEGLVQDNQSTKQSTDTAGANAKSGAAQGQSTGVTKDALQNLQDQAAQECGKTNNQANCDKAKQDLQKAQDTKGQLKGQDAAGNNFQCEKGTTCEENLKKMQDILKGGSGRQVAPEHTRGQTTFSKT